MSKIIKLSDIITGNIDSLSLANDGQLSRLSSLFMAERGKKAHGEIAAFATTRVNAWLGNRQRGINELFGTINPDINEHKAAKAAITRLVKDGTLDNDMAEDNRKKCDNTMKTLKQALDREWRKHGYKLKFNLVNDAEKRTIKAVKLPPPELPELDKEKDSDGGKGGKGKGGKGGAKKTVDMNIDMAVKTLSKNPRKTLDAIGLLLAKLDSDNLAEARKMLNLAAKHQRNRESANQKKRAAAHMKKQTAANQ